MKKVTILFVAVVTLLFTSCKKEYTITVQSNNEAWGSVIGSGTYAKGTVISIGAIAKSGYRFVSWQDGNTENPRSITVQSDVMYIATFTSDGEEPTNMGGISVSATQKVYFSPGNLQWSASGIHAIAGGGAEAGTWQFAPNQWDIIGADNKNISSTYTGWIDLFGWGTSGYNNKYPYMASTKETDYGNGGKNIFNTNYDWGVYNAIYNPQTDTTDAPGIWRTLTAGEWRYLLGTRTTTSGMRYAKALVNGVSGLIILPDNWSRNTYTLNGADNINTAYTSNDIDIYDWSTLERAGCVFLPAAGCREGTSVRGVGSYGYYWAGTWYLYDTAYDLYFFSTSLDPQYYDYRYRGNSVRLVKNVQQ